MDTAGNSAATYEAQIEALRGQVAALARANVHAAELMAELREARELEDLLRRQNETIARAEEVERARSAVLERTARHEPAGPLLEAVAEFLSIAVPGAAFSLFQVEDDRLRHACGGGLAPAFSSWLDRHPPEPDSPAGAAWVEARPVLWVESAGAAPSPFLDRCRKEGYRAVRCEPFLSSTGAALGVAVFYSAEPRHASPEESGFFAKAAFLAALGLEQRLLYEKLSFQANYDSLTELPNRTYFQLALQRAIEDADGRESGPAVVWIDLDRFKQINDTLGHRGGDELLRQAANRLSQSIRSGDVVARVGGDEFILLLPEVNGVEGAVAAARKLLSVFEKPFFIQNHEFVVSLSAGISIYPTHGRTGEELSRNADIAMYAAKHGGRNAYAVFNPESDQRIRDRFLLETNLRRAVERQELELYFQPQAPSGEPGAISAVEALLRWNSPELGSVPPDVFVPIAETTGLIVSIGRWVLETACATAGRWERAGRPVRMAVNVSVEQFTRPDFVALVTATLLNTGLSPRLLELELTESTILRDHRQCLANMRHLRGMEVSLAVDDFGTGYSSLSYLQQLPVNALKIDRSFIRNLPADTSSCHLVEAVMQLAQSLHIDVVAEGVETAGQLEVLRKMGCTYVQGYFISEPVPLRRIEERLDLICRWG
ncbi:MAG: EAL domain-containing protein [Bryobacteraceae bacterium]